VNCDSALCKGLVGAGAGAAALGAIGGIVAATWPKKQRTTYMATPAPTPSATEAPVITSLRAREQTEDTGSSGSSSNSLLWLLLGLLLLCCIAAAIAYFCMNKGGKRASKINNKAKRAPAPARDAEAPTIVTETAPLTAETTGFDQQLPMPNLFPTPVAYAPTEPFFAAPGAYATPAFFQTPVYPSPYAQYSAPGVIY
jgi:hypothetical protein